MVHKPEPAAKQPRYCLVGLVRQHELMDEAGMSLRAGLGFAFQAAVQTYIDFNQPGEISPMLDPKLGAVSGRNRQRGLGAYSVSIFTRALLFLTNFCSVQHG